LFCSSLASISPNLLQSRTETRRKEQAVRVSLGATRWRIIQQLFVESGLLAFTGGILGIGLTYLGIQLFRDVGDAFQMPPGISIDGRVLLFTLGLSFLTAILFGLAPALKASSPDLNLMIREGDRTRVAGSRGWARHALAVSEAAMAMVLLVGAGLMINTVLHLKQVNSGLDPRNILIAGISLPEGGRYLARVPGGDMEKPSPQVRTFYQQLLDRVAAAPMLSRSEC
jgi:putative ABC transport system permease protein